MNDKKPLRKRLKNGLIYLVLLGLMRLVKLLPRPIALGLARFLAFCGYGLAAGERRKIEANLTLAYHGSLTATERRRIGRAAFSNIAQNLVDALLMPSLLKDQPERIMRIDGMENAREALDNKKGIVFLTAHMGCFEMLSPRFAQLGFPMVVLGAKIYDPRLNDIIVANRQSFNVAYVERGGSLREIYQTLRSGGGFGVLCDLDTRVESRFVNFFGEPAKTPSGPFKIGVKWSIPMIPIFAMRAQDGCQQVTVFPALVPAGNSEEEKIQNAMQQYNDILEGLIRRDPAQWIWMHDRWKSKP